MGKGYYKSEANALGQQAQVGEQQLGLAKQLITESSPWRQYAGNTYMGLAKGNMPGIQSLVAPQINAADQQYAIAEKQIKEMAPGGQRDSLLRNLQLQKAGTKTGIYSGGVSESLARTASMGMGGTQQGVGAFGGASGTFGSNAQGYGSLANAKGSQWGQLAGAAGGALAAL
jgi:hypothetical protein